MHLVVIKVRNPSEHFSLNRLHYSYASQAKLTCTKKANNTHIGHSYFPLDLYGINLNVIEVGLKGNLELFSTIFRTRIEIKS